MRTLGKDAAILLLGCFLALPIVDAFPKTYDEKKAETLAVQKAKRIETETRYQSCMAACSVRCGR